MESQFTVSDIKDRSWVPQAACLNLDTEIFYPDDKDYAAIEAARTICRTCIVRPACLEYALMMNETNGVWGGKSEHERQIIRRKRRAELAASVLGMPEAV